MSLRPIIGSRWLFDIFSRAMTVNWMVTLPLCSWKKFQNYIQMQRIEWSVIHRKIVITHSTESIFGANSLSLLTPFIFTEKRLRFCVCVANAQVASVSRPVTRVGHLCFESFYSREPNLLKVRWVNCIKFEWILMER